MKKNVLTADIASFDEIVAKYDGEGSNKEQSKLTKLIKESELSQLVSKSRLDYVKAQSAFEKSVITENSSLPEKAKELERAKNAYEFFDTLYSKVFPNGLGDDSSV